MSTEKDLDIYENMVTSLYYNKFTEAARDDQNAATEINNLICDLKQDIPVWSSDSDVRQYLAGHIFDIIDDCHITAKTDDILNCFKNLLCSEIMTYCYTEMPEWYRLEKQDLINKLQNIYNKNEQNKQNKSYCIII